MDVFAFWSSESLLRHAIPHLIVEAGDDSVLAGGVHNLGQLISHIAFGDVESIYSSEVLVSGKFHDLVLMSPATAGMSVMRKRLCSSEVLE